MSEINYNNANELLQKADERHKKEVEIIERQKEAILFEEFIKGLPTVEVDVQEDFERIKLFDPQNFKYFLVKNSPNNKKNKYRVEYGYLHSLNEKTETYTFAVGKGWYETGIKPEHIFLNKQAAIEAMKEVGSE